MNNKIAIVFIFQMAKQGAGMILITVARLKRKDACATIAVHDKKDCQADWRPTERMQESRTKTNRE